ncbi:protein translocase subunit SecDF [Alkaliflexus imshenetskii]|uniref:protein translocase subunit SecDF n=1 Tax=Alkaliflexus imshenetskii TaxID=286730 RepID=UPI00047B7D31|nr:protein translocase subunit SecDF [Alkaliflexus imshenetskii]
MQNKGAIRLFAILLALVSLYQLTFTYHSRKVEKDALQYATMRAGEEASPEIIRRYEVNYLDSMAHETVYNFLFGLRKYTYMECKSREINFGLDLKGGMNLILEVKVADIIQALSNYNQDENFLRAIALAEEREKTSVRDFVSLFGDAFQDVAPNGSLAAIFNTVELRDKVKYDSSNEEVLRVLREESRAAIDNAFNIIRTRIDRFGVVQPNVQRLQKDGQVLIELPGVTEPERVRNLLKGSASLEFWETYDNQEIFEYLAQANNVIARMEQRTAPAEVVTDTVAVAAETTESDLGLLREIESDTVTTSEEGRSLFTLLQPSGRATGPVVGVASGRNMAQIDQWLQSDQVRAVLPRDLRLMWTVKPIPASDLQFWVPGVGQTRESFFQLVAIRSTSFDGRPPLEGDAITNARDRVSPTGSFEIEMSMNSEGAKTWARLTKANIGKSIAIVLDGYVYSFPTVQNEIRGGQSSITGNFSPEEAKDLANILRSGKLPAPARIVEDTVVGPSLGKEAVDAGLKSFIWAFFVVLLYMIIYYGIKAGIVADIALIANMFFVMGVLAAFNAILTLPGIAGIVLTIGMSVDANVLIYERIREELRAGKGLRLAISDGYKNAFSAIIDANVTTFLTGLILFLFGTGPIKGFATTLMIGIATSFFSAIFITRLVYEWLLNSKVDVSFGSKWTENLFKNLHIKFMEKRTTFFILSGAFIIIAIGSLSIRGLKQGIDFTGGRTYVVRFADNVNSSDIFSSVAAAFEGANTEVKTFGTANQIRIATNYLVFDTDESADVMVENSLFQGIKPFLPAGTTQEEFNADFVMSSQKVGPTIATDIRNKAGLAIFFSLVVIFLYILIRFRTWQLGLGAIAAVIHDAMFVLGIFSLFYTIVPFAMEIDQAFIAAILTVIGYSINDTVVVFDRIREYRILYPKRSTMEVFDLAINSTISRTINTSMTTLVVLLVIFVFGSEVIRGFVFALIIGVFVGTYSSIFIASPIAYNFIKRNEKAKLDK